MIVQTQKVRLFGLLLGQQREEKRSKKAETGITGQHLPFLEPQVE